MFSLSRCTCRLPSVHVFTDIIEQTRARTKEQGKHLRRLTPHTLFCGPYPAFYPPDARNYQYKRHLMVAVDGSKESEHAVEWTIGHLCRSGDLLHIVHVETAGDMDPRLNTYGSFARTHSPSVPGARNDIGLAVPFPANVGGDDGGDDAAWAPKPMLEFRVSPRSNRAQTDLFAPPKKKRFLIRSPTSRAFPDAVDLSLMVDPEAQEQYWSNAVKRTEEMLDEVYDRLKATHGEFVNL